MKDRVVKYLNQEFSRACLGHDQQRRFAVWYALVLLDAVAVVGGR